MRGWENVAVAAAGVCGGAPASRSVGLGRVPVFRVMMALALAAGLILTAVGSGSRPVSAEGQWAAVNANGVLVRDDAGFWANVLGGASAGQWFEVTGGPTTDDWYAIDYYGTPGYIFGDYLSWDGAGGETAGGASAVTDTTGVMALNGGATSTSWVNTDALVVRADASSDSNVVGTMYWGQAVSVLGEQANGYVLVSTSAGSGWMWGQDLSVVPVGAGSGNAPVATDTGGGTATSSTKWIDVDRSSQLVTLYEGDTPIYQVWGSMSKDQSDEGFWATANGTYHVFEKDGPIHYTPYGHAWVRYYVGFDPMRDNGFHSYSLEEWGAYTWNYTEPTGGCVSVELGAAETIYNFADYGTRVEVHW